MCNDYKLEVDIVSIAEDFDNLSIKIKMPEGTPNVPARADIGRRADPAQRGRGKRARRVSQPAMELAGTRRQACLQLALGRARVYLGPVPDPGRWLLRVHQARGSQAEAAEQMAVHASRPSLVLH